MAAPNGTFKGQPMSPDGMKFKLDFQGIPVHVDRPRGFIMTGTDDKGVAWTRQYNNHYGFIPRTKGGDGDQLDVFVGPKKNEPNAFWAIQKKADGTFDEYKVFLGFENRDEATAVYRKHIPKKLLSGMITMRVDMMKSMLGINGDGYGSGGLKKTAEYVGLLDELEKIGKDDLMDKFKGYVGRRSIEQKIKDKIVDTVGELREDVGL